MTIDKDLFERIRAYAQRTGQTVEQVVQEAAQRLLKEAGSPSEGKPDDELLQLSGIADSSDETKLIELERRILSARQDAGGTLGDSLMALSGAFDSGYTNLSERVSEIRREEVDPVRGLTFNRDGDS